MNFEQPLIMGTLIQRYKRFLADVRLPNGDVVTAHCPNTGSMKSCWEPGATIYMSPATSETRKLKYTWEFTEIPKGFIGINTARPNEVVEEAIRAGQIPELAGYSSIRREVKYGQNSRIDLLLSGLSHQPEAKCWVEIKNVTLLSDGKVMFPDAVTSRGQKHLEDLAAQVAKGDRAVMFYFVNRPDGTAFGIASDIDPDYAAAFTRARKAGVEILAYRSNSSLTGIGVGKKLSIDF